MRGNFANRHLLLATCNLQQMKKKTQVYFFLAAALLIACVAAFPLLAQPGLLNTRGGGDSPFLLQRLHQLETAVLDGHFPARWMPDANYGYGYPFFNYYAPLSIYIAFLFRLVGFSYVRAIHLAQLSGFVVAAWGMFVLGRRWFGSEWAGLLTAVAYTVAPFHLVNIYARGDSLAEFWAMAFYPLVILAADRILEPDATVKEKRIRVALLALAYAGLILSHNISALIFSPFLILYILLRWFTLQRSARHTPPAPFTPSPLHLVTLSPLLPPFTAGLLALTLAAWFFVPALAETGLAQLSTVTEGYFFYGTHFLGTEKLPLAQNSFFFDFSVNGRSAFRMGLVQAILAGASLLSLTWLWLRKKINQTNTPHPLTQAAAGGTPLHPFTPSPPHPFIFITLLTATLMTLPQSNWLWENVPLLSFTQFPWRFLSVQAFGIALAAGGLALLPGKQWLVPVVTGVLVLSSLGQLRTDYLILSDADVTAEKLAQYEWFTGNIGTTVSAEYLPQTVQPRPYTSAWLNTGERDWVVALAGEVKHAELWQRKATQQLWRVETAVPTTLRFDTLYWPGWTAKVDGKAVPIRPSAGSGLIEMDIVPGAHQIELRLVRTVARLWAEWLSLTAVFVVMWLLRPVKWPQFKPVYAYGGLGFVVVVIIVSVWPRSQWENNTLNWDFGQMGYLHHAPAGIAFENGVRLRRYELDKTVVQAGEVVTIRLEWDGSAAEATIAMTSPAVNRPEFEPAAPVLVSQTHDQSVYQLTIPETAPAGLYVPRVTLENGRSLTLSGSKRGDLFLQPIRVVNKRTTIKMEQPFDVQAVGVVAGDGNVLDVQLGWRVERPLSHNYNVALRLTDANGNFLRLADHQPGYGYQPSSNWLPGIWNYDWQAMSLPPEEEGHQQPFMLVAQLYEAENPANVVLTRRLGELTRQGAVVDFRPTEPVFTLPQGMEPVTAVFGDEIQLVGYTYSQSENMFHLELAWQAITNGRTDYIRFVHLIDPDDASAPAAQVDSMPRNNSYPTSQWTSGEVVTEQVELNLNDVPAGVYQVAVGFYTIVEGEGVRVTAVDQNNVPFTENRFLLPVLITVP